MSATFGRIKVWMGGEVLTASDLNAEFDNILQNLTPTGISSASEDINAMRATTDPYPGGAEYLALTLREEIQSLRFLIKQITGKSLWYIDPDVSLSNLSATSTPTFAGLTLSTPLAISSGGTGLSALGSANQILGVNAEGNAFEYKTITGTANVIVTNMENSIILATPQDIHTGATPTFAGLDLTGLTDGYVPYIGVGALADSPIYISGTNVGIGTTTPGYSLDVSGETKSTEGFILNKKTITLTTAPKWLRFAVSKENGGSNAGIFEIRWTRSGVLGHIIFNTGANYNDASGINLNLLGGSSYGNQGITKIRLLRKTTNDLMYLELYAAYGDATNSMSIEVRQLSGYGWSMIDIVNGSIPTGYTAHELSTSGAFAVNEDSKTFMVTKDGKVGIGTTAPSAPLHVANPSTTEGALETVLGRAIGDTNFWLVTKKGVTTNNSGDVLLKLGLTHAGTTYDNAYIRFHRGGGTGGGFLSFSTASDIERVRIDASGHVGIGVTDPSYQLHLSQNSAAKPGSSTWTVSSDERIKKNIMPADLSRCYEIVKNIPLVHYSWDDGLYDEQAVKDRSQLGWLAQQVEPFFPKAITTHKVEYMQEIEDGVEEYEEHEYMSKMVDVKRIEVIDGVPTEIIVKEEQKEYLYDEVQVVDKNGNTVLDENGNPKMHKKPRMIKKTRPKMRPIKTIEDCKGLDIDQIMKALYGAVQLLINKVEKLEAKAKNK